MVLDVLESEVLHSTNFGYIHPLSFLLEANYLALLRFSILEDVNFFLKLTWSRGNSYGSDYWSELETFILMIDDTMLTVRVMSFGYFTRLWSSKLRAISCSLQSFVRFLGRFIFLLIEVSLIPVIT